jgi:hypothetical protein
MLFPERLIRHSLRSVAGVKKPSESLDNKKQAVILFVERALGRQTKTDSTQDNSYEPTFNPDTGCSNPNQKP